MSSTSEPMREREQKFVLLMPRKNNLFFWGTDRVGAAIYLHFANMETEANYKIATKLNSDPSSAQKLRNDERER